MINIQDIEDRICRALEIIRTTNILEDEKAKALLWETASDMLETTAKLLRPEKSVEVEDDE